MTRSHRTLVVSAIAVIALVLTVAACGSSSDKASTKSGGSSNSNGSPAQKPKKGGTVTILGAGDFIDTDCGKAYYQYDYMICYATQRPLYSYKPDDKVNPQPDMAAGPPVISDGGKTLTIKLKPGIKYSPPLKDRVVKAADVKYALERMFFASVANGYAGAYMGTIVGAKVAAKSGTAISGITTPDDNTVVLKLKNSSAAVVAQALSLPGSAPVPEDYAKQYDAKVPSTYKNYQVSTGPYMIQQDASGKAVGYKVGKTTTVVRNPNWDPKTDYRPAPLDGFTFKAGNDPSVASKQIFQGKGLVNGDFAPLPQDIKLAVTKYKGQLNTNPSGAFRYVAMNTTKKPWSNVDVRRAVIAGFDRKAMQLSRGGDAIGTVATHWITPGFPGFDEAGGKAGPDLDYLKNERGDIAVAAKYMKAAGYPSGKYTGSEQFLMIGNNSGTGKKAAQVAQAQFEKLGFHIKLRLVTPDAMYSKFCQVPKSGYDICPNVAWGKDFTDPQSLLDVPFNGENIVQESNSNHALFNDKTINKEMDDAKLVVDLKDRAAAWGKVDTDLMKQAAAVPWLWDNQPNISSKDVAAVLNQFNSNWDMSFTGLK
jgi:peptide/nickel transport system substrate-binding protein